MKYSKKSIIADNNAYENLFLEIDKFNSDKTGQFFKKKSPLNGINVSITTVLNNIKVEFDWDRFSNTQKRLKVGQYHKRVDFHSGGKTYVLLNLFLSTQSSHYFKGDVSFIHTKGFSSRTKYYYRLVVPLTKEFILTYYLSTREVFINNDQLIFKVRKYDTDKNYLIVQSRLKQTYEEFSNKVFALKVALGYITGYLSGDYGFFCAYSYKRMQEVKHIYRCEFRNSIKSSYSPIYSNPFGYIRNNKIAEKYYDLGLLRPMNTKELSSLCQHLFDSDQFTSAIILILESSIASLLFMPGGFAIALEMLTDIIKPNKKSKLAPMSPSISKNVRKECREIIDKYSETISNENLLVLDKRIEMLNQVPNTAKLKVPFKYLNIELSQEDIKVLNTRNDLLHGAIPDFDSLGPRRSLDKKNNDLYYTALSLYTLLNLLILKWIGYDNYIVNYPKINEKYTGIKVKGSPFRLVK